MLRVWAEQFQARVQFEAITNLTLTSRKKSASATTPNPKAVTSMRMPTNTCQPPESESPMKRRPVIRPLIFFVKKQITFGKVSQGRLLNLP